MRTREVGGQYAQFGALLVRSRIEAGLTHEALGHMIGCSVTYLARIEAGKKLPAVLLFAKWRHVLGFDANVLLDALDKGPPGEPYHAFGHILQVARGRCEMEPSEVARAARCKVATYKRAERGKGLPSVVVLSRLHGVLRFNGDAALRAVRLADEHQREVA